MLFTKLKNQYRFKFDTEAQLRNFIKLCELKFPYDHLDFSVTDGYVFRISKDCGISFDTFLMMAKRAVMLQDKGKIRMKKIAGSYIFTFSSKKKSLAFAEELSRFFEPSDISVIDYKMGPHSVSISEKIFTLNQKK